MKISQWFQIITTGCFLFASSALIAADENIAWEHNCSSIKDWYSNAQEPNFHAKIEQFEPSVFKVTQEGDDTWGKVAFVVKDVDLDQSPNIEVKINKVDKDSAFKVAVAPIDWSDTFVVIPRSSADGVHKGNIKDATGWTGKKTFNVVLIIEGKGKAAYFDHIKITSKK